MGNNQRRYTEEQIKWLTNNYPNLGKYETTVRFNDIFHEDRSIESIRCIVEKLKLKVTDETRRRLNASNFGKTYCKMGAIRISKKTGGEPYIKTEKGWVMLKQQIVDCPKGMSIIHLDGDLSNCNKDNLMIVERAVLGKMIANDFWSSDPQITKTGVIWSQLDLALQRTGAKVPKKITKPKPKKGLEPKTNTGEFHISKLANGKFRVHIHRNNTYVNRVSFLTLESAIAFRDSILDLK